MDETVDLRPYVEAVAKNWWKIIGAMILATLAVLGLYALGKPNYEATALIAITNPTQEINLDPRIRDTLELNDLARAFPELAMSDSVLTEVLAVAKTEDPDSILTLVQLREHLQATTGDDVRLLRLVTTMADPALAARTANTWANAFLSLVNTIYVGSREETGFYQQQLADAAVQLETTEAALVDFQSINRQTVIDNELMSLSTLQASYLSDQRTLSLVMDDVNALLYQLDTGSRDAVTLADQVTSFALQLKAYDAQLPAGAAQFQLAADSNLTTTDRPRQIELLSALAATIDSQQGATNSRLAEIEPQLLDLQRQKQELTAKSDRLTRDRDVAQETYVALARKVDELRITAENASSGIHLASQAAIPTEPTRASLPMLIVIGLTVGFLGSLAVIILLTWWRTSQSSSDQPITP